MYLIETKALTKCYKKQKANDAIDFKVMPNTIYGLLGPNGAGKSTLLKMLTGMQAPTSGEILWEGKPMTRKDLAYVGALIEQPPLYKQLTARENLKVRTLLYGLPEARIDEVLSLVDLTDTGKKRAGQFSLGMKQRLGIALALLNHPKLLILDEPTNGLDPIGIGQLRTWLKTLPQQGITVIISSHILSEIEQVADDIGMLVNGKLMYQAPLEAGEDLEAQFIQMVKRGGVQGC